MTSSRGMAHWLRGLSIAVTLAATGAGSYVLLLSPSSGWLDRAMGAGLLAFTIYGLFHLRDLDNELVSTSRARDSGGIFIPLFFPFVFASWAEERGSALAWLGWALFVVGIAVQIALWRVDRPLTRETPQTASSETPIRHEDAV